MTRFIHDKFAKDYLEELLTTFGTVQADQELIMRLSPLFDQQLEHAKQQARQEGQRRLIENILASRFGSLDEQLTAMISPLLALPPEELAPLLLQLSREELLSRFGEQN